LRRVGDSRRSELESLKGTSVELLSAIGNPAGFERTVAALGAKVESHLVRPDHHEWSAEELRGLAGTSRRVLTTSKDAVKLEALGEAAQNFEVLEIELVVTRGEAVLAALLDGLSPGQAARERASLHEGLHG
jgi:tetraacyldisaccharide 4'-kinase